MHRPSFMPTDVGTELDRLNFEARFNCVPLIRWREFQLRSHLLAIYSSRTMDKLRQAWKLNSEPADRSILPFRKSHVGYTNHRRVLLYNYRMTNLISDNPISAVYSTLKSEVALANEAIEFSRKIKRPEICPVFVVDIKEIYSRHARII